MTVSGIGRATRILLNGDLRGNSPDGLFEQPDSFPRPTADNLFAESTRTDGSTTDFQKLMGYIAHPWTSTARLPLFIIAYVVHKNRKKPRRVDEALRREGPTMARYGAECLVHRSEAMGPSR